MTISSQDTDQIKPHLLVVDDEADICRMVANSLQRAGFHVSTAHNAADAYSLLTKAPFDAILTDVMMPGEDGVAFLGRVHQAWPDVPVILMTGYAQLQMAVNAIKQGAFDFVHKPFDLGHLRRIVERAVNYTKLQRMEKNYLAELEETVASRTAELKGALVELDLARSALLKNAIEKNEFMSTISHEMRTPMNGVVGGLSLLEKEVVTADGKEFLDIVRQSADKMVALIDQLLMFGRGAGAGSGAAGYDRIDLAEDLQAIIYECRPEFEKKGISLELQIAADVPEEIWASRDHFDRLWGILLNNAAKFTDRGGVKLAVSCHDSRNTGRMLNFSLSDSGIGIPQWMLESIFDPFVQGDGSHTRRHGGVGLGLAIARQNALILNGRLWAEHLPEGGSCFKFQMKLSEL